MSRHVVDREETAVVDLLLAAGLVEADDLDQKGVEEIGDGRVVEREVAVLADPRANDVGGLGAENFLVVEARLQGPRRLLAGDEPETVALREADEPEEPLVKV